jgi:hypothetical protein
MPEAAGAGRCVVYGVKCSLADNLGNMEHGARRRAGAAAQLAIRDMGATGRVGLGGRYRGHAPCSALAPPLFSLALLASAAAPSPAAAVKRALTGHGRTRRRVDRSLGASSALLEASSVHTLHERAK